jgi:RimJ/RimL family protein N-acetyltransferase
MELNDAIIVWVKQTLFYLVYKNNKRYEVKILETRRLIIRKITIDDADFIFKLVNEPSFVLNIGDKGLKTMDDVMQFIREGYWTNQEKSGYGQFIVELKSGGDPIGICGLLYRKSLDVTDIGFALLPEYWGQELGFEAAKAVLDYGHSTLGIETIVGLTTHHNHASINLLKKLGMQFEREVKMSDDDPGTVLYS